MKTDGLIFYYILSIPKTQLMLGNNFMSLFYHLLLFLFVPCSCSEINSNVCLLEMVSLSISWNLI